MTLIRPIAAVVSLTAGLMASTAINAGTIEGFTGPFGFGFVLADEDEGVVDPGIFAVTGDINNDDFVGNEFSPSGVLNCLRSSQPGAGCAEGPGTGNRFKTFMTGNGALDLVFSTADSSGITEYFNYGKTSNTTGARIQSFQLQLGTGTGDDFVAMDPSNPASAVLFDNLVTLSEANAIDWPFLVGTEGQAPLQRSWFPDGLFGDGGQEGDIGFFSPERAGFELTSNTDLTVLSGANLTNADHLDLFGDSLLARTMLPDGMFWDEVVADTTDEDALIAWYDHRANGGAGNWVWGSMNADATDLAARLADLADVLGVTVADLSYASGDEIPANIAALMEAGDVFEVLPIEDLSNVNLNFNLDVGDIALGEFTLRIVPTFAPIVEVSATDFQFGMAATLDAANVPFLNADPGYLGALAAIEALPTAAEQQLALESVGYSFLGAYSGLAYSFGSESIAALNGGELGQGANEQPSRGAGNWSVGDGTRAFVKIGGTSADYDRTANNAGFSTSSFSFHGGFERALNENVTAGLMFGAQQGEASIMAGRGSLDAEAYTIAGFTRLNVGGVRVQAAAGYQDLSYDSTRNITFGTVNQTATGSTNGETVFASLGADWMMQKGAMSFGPMASAEYYKISVDGFSETGAGLYNLDIGAQDAEVTVARLGLRGETQGATKNGGNFKAFGYAAWAARSGDDMTVSTSFSGSNLPTFAAPVDGLDDNWLDLGAGVSWTLSNQSGKTTRVGLGYNGALSSGYEEHRGNLFVEMVF